MESHTAEVNSMLRSAIEGVNEQGQFARLCVPEKAASIVAAAKSHFVKDHRRHWWWEAFSRAPRRRGISDESPYITQYVEASEPCWLIIDDDSVQFPVIETTAATAHSILWDMPFVEFYMVGKEFTWLLAENHHGAIWLL